MWSRAANNPVWPVGVLAMALLLSACSDSAEESGSKNVASVYRHSMDGVPRSLDPAQASSIYAKMLVVNLYDTLYRYKYLARPYELAPNLAEALPEVSADGLIYTIRIKPGVYFINDDAFPEGKGRAVAAEDFVYSIARDEINVASVDGLPDGLATVDLQQP